MDYLQRRLLLPSRLKLYLIIAFASLIPFFYSVAQIAYVISEPSDLLGLASHFTVAYWIGLALILISSILVFLDKELKKDAGSISKKLTLAVISLSKSKISASFIKKKVSL